MWNGSLAPIPDRLVIELRLAAYLPRFNAQFAVPPLHVGTAFRPLPAGVKVEEVLCFKYVRTVAASQYGAAGGASKAPAPGQRAAQLCTGPGRGSRAARWLLGCLLCWALFDQLACSSGGSHAAGTRWSPDRPEPASSLDRSGPDRPRGRSPRGCRDDCSCRSLCRAWLHSRPGSSTSARKCCRLKRLARSSRQNGRQKPAVFRLSSGDTRKRPCEAQTCQGGFLSRVP